MKIELTKQEATACITMIAKATHKDYSYLEVNSVINLLQQKIVEANEPQLAMAEPKKDKE